VSPSDVLVHIGATAVRSPSVAAAALAGQIRSAGFDARGERKEARDPAGANAGIPLQSAGRGHYIAPSPFTADRLPKARRPVIRGQMDRQARLKRLRFRAWHRGTREADMLIGGFFDRHHAGWSAEEIAWFEALLEEQDVDIMAWAIGTAVPPARFQGPLMTALTRLDYIEFPEMHR
jgi:antitoxin CptB